MADPIPFDLDSFKAEIRRDKSRPIITGGKTFWLQPPELLTDEQYAAIQASDDADLVGQARVMIDDYDGFVAAGGSAMLLVQIVKKLDAERTGGDLGESEASTDS